MAENCTISVGALDPIDILNSLADSCNRSDDDVFWVLTSAAAYLNGFDMSQGDPHVYQRRGHRPSSMAILLRARGLDFMFGRSN
jgi:hypothetical protein